MTRSSTVSTLACESSPCKLSLKPSLIVSRSVPIPAGSNEVKTWEYKVVDEKPVWFYCKQRPAGAPKGHCALGMNGAINPPKSGPKTLAEFKKLAEKST